MPCSATQHPPLDGRTAQGLRIGIPRGLLFTHADTQVLHAFEATADLLRAAHAFVCDVHLDNLSSTPFQLPRQGTLIAAEAAHYVGVQQARSHLRQQLDSELVNWDVLMLPTVPIVAYHR